jgi:hypothetical protein
MNTLSEVTKPITENGILQYKCRIILYYWRYMWEWKHFWNEHLATSLSGISFTLVYEKRAFTSFTTMGGFPGEQSVRTMIRELFKSNRDILFKFIHTVYLELWLQWFRICPNEIDICISTQFVALLLEALEKCAVIII